MITNEKISTTGLTMAKVEAMTHFELCRFWRFAPIGALQTGDPVSDRLEARFKELGGFTTEISKQLGWGR